MEQLSKSQLAGLIKALLYIEDNLSSALNLETIAAQSPWSRWQLQRLIVASTGLTLAQYVRELRLSNAARALLSSKDRQIDIALRCGFESEISFCRSFRQYYSCSPGQYRKRGILTGIRLPLTQTKLNPIRIDFKAAFKLQGYKQKTKGLFSKQPDFHTVIPDIWKMAIEKNPFWLKQSSPLYGAFHSENDQKECDFTYWAGIETPISESTGKGNFLTLPDQTYAVVTHRNNLASFSQTVEWMLEEWLPDSGLKYSLGTDLESYPLQQGKIKQQSAEYWLPIKTL